MAVSLGVALALLLNVASANGFGFQMARMAPIQMEIQLPAGGPGPFQALGGSPFGVPSPLMSMMSSFPPVFNPMEAVGGGDVLAGDSRADVNGPMGNVTTKNSTESKDGFKVTTITSDGPGFHSYIKEYEKEGNSSTNGTRGEAGPPPDIGNLLSGGKIFDIMNQLRNMQRKKAPKCKKCGKGKFCDPIFHLCRKKFSEGRTCMAQKQCGANLRCQWGKCQKAKKGDPGTFCKGNNQCSGDSCCRNTPGSFHLMCIPPQTEGAICGLHERQESMAKLFYVVKRSAVPTCAPCATGLKCANTGGSRFKRCAPENYVERAAEELEDDNPSNAITDDEKDDKKEKEDKKEDKEEGGSGNDEEEEEEDASNHPLADPNVPDRDDKPDHENADDTSESKEDKEEDDDEKEDKEDKDDDKEDKKDDDNEDKKDEDKDEKDDEDKEDKEDKEEDKDKDVSKDDDKKNKKKPIPQEGIEIMVPKKKKGTNKKGKKGKKGKGKGKKE